MVNRDFQYWFKSELTIAAAIIEAQRERERERERKRELVIII